MNSFNMIFDQIKNNKIRGNNDNDLLQAGKLMPITPSAKVSGVIKTPYNYMKSTKYIKIREKKINQLENLLVKATEDINSSNKDVALHKAEGEITSLTKYNKKLQNKLGEIQKLYHNSALSFNEQIGKCHKEINELNKKLVEATKKKKYNDKATETIRKKHRTINKNIITIGRKKKKYSLTVFDAYNKTKTSVKRSIRTNLVFHKRSPILSTKKLNNHNIINYVYNLLDEISQEMNNVSLTANKNMNNTDNYTNQDFYKLLISKYKKISNNLKLNKCDDKTKPSLIHDMHQSFMNNNFINYSNKNIVNARYSENISKIKTPLKIINYTTSAYKNIDYNFSPSKNTNKCRNIVKSSNNTSCSNDNMNTFYNYTPRTPKYQSIFDR